MIENSAEKWTEAIWSLRQSLPVVEHYLYTEACYQENWCYLGIYTSQRHHKSGHWDSLFLKTWSCFYLPTMSVPHEATPTCSLRPPLSLQSKHDAVTACTHAWRRPLPVHWGGNCLFTCNEAACACTLRNFYTEWGRNCMYTWSEATSACTLRFQLWVHILGGCLCLYTDAVAACAQAWRRPLPLHWDRKCLYTGLEADSAIALRWWLSVHMLESGLCPDTEVETAFTHAWRWPSPMHWCNNCFFSSCCNNAPIKQVSVHKLRGSLCPYTEGVSACTKAFRHPLLVPWGDEYLYTSWEAASSVPLRRGMLGGGLYHSSEAVTVCTHAWKRPLPKHWSDECLYTCIDVVSTLMQRLVVYKLIGGFFNNSLMQQLPVNKLR